MKQGLSQDVHVNGGRFRGRTAEDMNDEPTTYLDTYLVVGRWCSNPEDDCLDSA